MNPMRPNSEVFRTVAYKGGGSVRIYLETPGRRTWFVELGGPEVWWKPKHRIDQRTDADRWGWLILAVGRLA